MGDRMGSSPIDRTNRKDDETIVFFHFLTKMSRRCHVVDAHVRFARATQIQVLDYPSLAVDRTKKMTCTFIVQVFVLQGSKGLERDVKKTARCAVFSPRRDSNRVSGANKGVQNACARRVAEQVPSTAPTEKTIILSSFFHFLPKMMRRCRLFQTHLKKTDKSHVKKSVTKCYRFFMFLIIYTMRQYKFMPWGNFSS